MVDVRWRVEDGVERKVILKAGRLGAWEGDKLIFDTPQLSVEGEDLNKSS